MGLNWVTCPKMFSIFYLSKRGKKMLLMFCFILRYLCLFFSIAGCWKWSISVRKACRGYWTLQCCYIMQCWVTTFCSGLFLQSCCCIPSSGPNIGCHCRLQLVYSPWWKLCKGLILIVFSVQYDFHCRPNWFMVVYCLDRSWMPV